MNPKHTELEAAITETLALLLGRDIAPGENVNKETEAAWDSFKHIEIILTLEEKFKVSFAPEDIPFMTSLGTIIAKIKETVC